MFFSDIHGNSYAFNEFLSQSEQLEINQYIFLGDVFGYYYGQDEIVDKLRGLEKLYAVQGNHDHYYLDLYSDDGAEGHLVKKYGNSYKGIKNRISSINKEFMKSLPRYLEIHIMGKRIGIFHGSVKDPIHGRIYPDTKLTGSDGYESFDYVIHGHTHYRMVRHLGSTTIINPGSIGQPRDKNGFSYATLTLPDGNVEFHEITWDRNLLLKDIEKYDNGNQKLIDILFRNEETNYE